MKVKLKFLAFKSLVVHVYLFAFVGAQNFKRENLRVSFAKFVKASSVKLNVLKLANLQVSKLGECTFECVNNDECYSVNFGAPLSDGQHYCELLGTDRFRQPSSLTVDDAFDHYYIKTPCMTDPCKNGATCSPIYHLDDYECVCLPGYTGQHCETVNWIQMTPSSVCFGARDDSFGTFTAPINGSVITFKLIYQSGYIQCAIGSQSHWGCYNFLIPEGHNIGTHITDSQKNHLLPKDEFMADASSSDCLYKFYYSLPGLTAKSPELLFDNFTTPRYVSAGEQFQIWFAEDLGDCYEDNNSGTTCVEVYGLFV